MVAWDVFLNSKLINTVFYEDNCNTEYVKDSLINHDGFSPNIKVAKQKE